MKTFMVLARRPGCRLPRKLGTDDVRSQKALVRYFLEVFTKRGDKVLDPFAGFGTTLEVSERLGRIPFGIEMNRERVEYARTQIKHKSNLIYGNAMKLDSYGLPRFDFCFTSPTYMTKNETKNPLASFEKGDYGRYLGDLAKIFSRMKKVMKSNAYIVIEVSNLKEKGVTTLAWDIAGAVSRTLSFKGEVIIGWEGPVDKTGGVYGYGYDHCYCLVFRNCRKA